MDNPMTVRDQQTESPNTDTEQSPPAGGKLRVGRKLLGEILIDARLIDEKMLSQGLERQRSTGERLGEALISLGAVTEEDIVIAMAEQLDLQVFDPSKATAIDPEVVLSLPENLAREHHVVPIARRENVLTLATSDPLDLLAIDDVRMATGCEVELHVGRKADIDQALASGYRSVTAGRRLEEAIDSAKLEFGIAEDSSQEQLNEQELRSKAEDAPIIRVVNLILGQAMAERATDIHIEPLEDRVVVRYRVDGVLYDAITPPKRFQDAIVVRIKILSDMDVAERRVPLDGRFTMRFENRDVDVRVSTMPTIYGEKVAMRLLDKSAFTADLNQLGFEPWMLERFAGALKKPHGMVLISGPTGSGKSTTLYSGLSVVDHMGKNVMTLEDPVEYHLARVNQVSINAKAGMTFASGLRALLRQDPDIIMVGEVRDQETAELTVRSALTGHLVLSTVHANNASSTATRLVDMGIEPYLVTSAVHLVMAQRLVRKICHDCAAPYEPDQLAVRQFGEESFEGVEFVRGSGCKYCKGRGYRGRTGVFELLEMTQPIAELVLRRASAEEIQRRAVELGFVTLKQNAISKVREGVTTVEEALAVCAGVV